MADPHAWSWEDDVVAFCLYRLGTADITLDDVEGARGIRPQAMNMRIANFKALDGGVGLGNASRQSLAVFEKHKDTPDDELREMALAILRGGDA